MKSKPVHIPKRPIGEWFSSRPVWVALVGLLLLTLAMFSDALISGGSLVPSGSRTDLSRYFVHWRTFGFNELRQGKLALWNPYLYSGAPFLGGFQAGLLYPLNFLFLIFPLGFALTLSIALHVFLAGTFTYFWAANRRLHPLAGFLAAIMFMFGGPYFLHVYAGHLPNLCTMIWAPLLFLAIDRSFEHRFPDSILLGVFAVAMMILAGHPQYVFYTAVIAALYCGLNWRALRSLKVTLGLLLIASGGAALTAVQLGTGFAEAQESLRSVGLSYLDAAMFSFAPDNFLTLLAPSFFGGINTTPYWGRWFFWEMNLFMGVTGMALAFYGAIAGSKDKKQFLPLLIGVLVILALGFHTPLFKLVYAFVPGFNEFRGVSKFSFLISLFSAMLAAIGLDKIMRATSVSPHLVLCCGIGSAILFILSQVIYTASNGGWLEALQAISSTSESYLSKAFYSDGDFIWRSKVHAAQTLAFAGATLFVLALLLGFGRKKPRLILLVPALAILELFLFARSSLGAFQLSEASFPELDRFIADHPGDYRMAFLPNPNAGMTLNRSDIFGDDPGAIRRYAEFLAFSQGVDPAKATQDIRFVRDHRFLDMLRCRFVFIPQQDGTVVLGESQSTLPRFLLVQNARVMEGRDAIFAAMDSKAFDPRKEIILEQLPNPQPEASNASGSIRVVNDSTDLVTIEVSLSSPAILLMTDVYAKGWHAVPMEGSVQHNYQLLPADYCLRGIPLGAGNHRIRIEYSPLGFRIGKWVSLVSLPFYVGLLIYWAKSPGRIRREV